MGGEPPSGSPRHPPDDAQQLTEEIERTRARLGATAEQLAAKADMAGKGRAQFADLAGRGRSVGAKAGRQAAAVPESLRQALFKPAGVARDKWVLCSLTTGAALTVAGLVIWRHGKR
jgi:Na+/alanine symporter